MKFEVEIYDTTLRDGSQGEGINFSVADKLRIAERIDAFGIHYIEGGWPGSNPKDIEFFGRARRKRFKHAKLAAFGATRRKGLRVEDDDQVRLLLEAGTPVVTIVGKTWLLHVKEVLRTTAEENLAMIGDTIRYLKDHGKLSSTTPSTALTALTTSRTTRSPPGSQRKRPARISSCSATRMAAGCRTKSPGSPPSLVPN